jgi:outer membrane protein OmpA-like peptidoglycan-associated protein
MATAAFLLLLLGACAGNSSYVALLESPDGSTGKIIVTGKRGEQVIDTAGTGALLDGSRTAESVPEEKLKQDFAAAMAARPLLPEHFLLYFESGGIQLTAESAALLPRIIENAAARPGVDVSIIGHTDTLGPADANEALALQRAQAVGRAIEAMGLKVKALTVESHGERNLLVQTPDETAEPRNRRVEIAVR